MQQLYDTRTITARVKSASQDPKMAHCVDTEGKHYSFTCTDSFINWNDILEGDIIKFEANMVGWLC